MNILGYMAMLQNKLRFFRHELHGFYFYTSGAFPDAKFATAIALVIETVLL